MALIAESASAPPQGLIHALLLDGRGGARELAWTEVLAWSENQGCLWLHFDYLEPGAQQWLRTSAGLNDIASEGLLSEETRPRTITRGNILLMALRGVNLQPGAEPEDMVSLRLWTDGTRVLSARHRKLLSTSDVLESLESGEGPVCAASLLVEWIDRIVRRMSDTVEDLEERALALEDGVLNGQTQGMRLELSQLRSASLTLRRWLAPQREALSRLCSEPLSWLDELNRLRLREVGDRQIRYLEDIEQLRERTAMIQEELLSRVSEQMNLRSYVFTVVATIFLPLGFFTGLMGINVGGMPGVESDGAFWVVVGMCVTLTASMAVLFRLKKWL